MTQRAFISYKSEHRYIAVRVRDSLQSWGYLTWFDQDDIPKGAYFRDAIQNGLECSDVIIGILTQKALQSREVLTEWDYAYSHKSRLLLLRFEDVKLPYWLAGVQYIDCTKDETIALQQLRQALAQTDTSKYSEVVPEEITRYRQQDTKDTYSYIPLDSAARKTSDNRTQMLENVYHTWIVGALHPNLTEGVIDLELGLKADAVLKHVDYGEYVLPNKTRDIDQIFSDMNGELLILGEPGSGKTILLLQLAEHLLAKAQQDDNLPIPVVFNLSSWAKGQKSLKDWLRDELKRAYQVPKKQADDWLDNNKLTLLLDGLDEIAPSQSFGNDQSEALPDEQAIQLRSACVDAINLYRSTRPGVDVVVCSRIKDYEALQQRFNLNSAILLQPLSDIQLKQYFSVQAFSGVRELLEKEETAYQLAQSPFVASIMKATYADKPYEGSPHTQLKLDDESLRQYNLFKMYANQQFSSHTYSDISVVKARYYLMWLAWQMLRNKTSVFYIEDLQPHWARNPAVYILLVGLIVGLCFGLIIGLSLGLNFGVIGGVAGGLVGGFTGLMVK